MHALTQVGLPCTSNKTLQTSIVYSLAFFFMLAKMFAIKGLEYEACDFVLEYELCDFVTFHNRFTR